MREKETVEQMKIKSIRYAGKTDVFNMEVDDTHDFVIQGGVISHNCADEWRYMCMARPIRPVQRAAPEPVGADPLNQYKGKNVLRKPGWFVR